MARVCAICNKSSHAGNQVSHSHRKTRRSWAPNLQRARVMIDGSPRTINVCTRCLRSGKVQRV
ncbi:MAG: 50S ribosomal protein L28 [Christensenellales bacterium]|jgi:large subunit ribosomal protein L28|nr:50S ribosomal protein L28 [Clostridiales bacterium]MBS6943430.1 50S ribosomal protein L28 [Clostridiales bacterium]